MSLTSHLRNAKDPITVLLKETLPENLEYFSMVDDPKKECGNLLVPPLEGRDVHDSGIVGTDFECLARLILAKKVIITQATCFESFAVMFVLKFMSENAWKTRLLKKAQECEKAIQGYFQGSFSDEEMVPWACFLGRFETLYRISSPSLSAEQIHFDLFLKEKPEIIQEVQSFIPSFKQFFLPVFKEDSMMIFDPSFGQASLDMGGADCDLFANGFLIDFKTVAKGPVTKMDLEQIWGYYLLHLVALKRKDEKALIPASLPPMRAIFLYLARFGIFLGYALDEETIRSAKRAANRLEKLLRD